MPISYLRPVCDMTERRVVYVDPMHSRRHHTLDELPSGPGKAVTPVEDPDASQKTLANGSFDGVVAVLDVARQLAEHARALPVIGFEDDAGGIRIHFLDVDGEPIYTQTFDSVAEVITLLLDGRLFATIPVLESEESRLETVHNLPLNRLEEEPSLQTLTELAARVFDVSSSFLGIVDADNEYFLSCFGTDLDTMNREDTICAHTLAQDEVLVVEDTRADPRFSDKGFAEQGVVWYAGAPIRNHYGEPIGTFCLTAEEQQEFSAEDQRQLQLFASEAWEIFELYTKLRDSRFIAGYI